MEDKLKLYLWWKKRLASAKEDGRAIFGMSRGNVSVEMGSGIVSEVMRKNERSQKGRASRWRVRGGGEGGNGASEGEMRNKASDIAE